MSLPRPYVRMKESHAEVMGAYERLGRACAEDGPLDARTIALVKLAISSAAGLEGAAHSHARKALDVGCTPDELLHVTLLCVPTIGFPAMMRARGWVEDVLHDRRDRDGR